MTTVAESSGVLPRSRDVSPAAVRAALGASGLAEAGRRQNKTHAREARALLTTAVRVGDFLIALAMAGFAYATLRHDLKAPFDFWLLAGLGSLVSVNVLAALRVYDFSSLLSLRRQIARVLAGWLATVLLLVPLVWLGRPSIASVSWDWLAAWALFCATALVLVRVGLRDWIKGRAANSGTALRVVVLGADSSANDVANQLRRSGDTETEVAVLYPGDGAHETEAECINRLLQMTRERRIDEVVVNWPVGPAPFLQTVLGKLGEIPVDIKLHTITPEVSRTAWLNGPAEPPLALVHARPLAGWGSIVKRGLDLVLGVGLLLAASPLMAVIALAIVVTSRGPVLFRQLRFGLNGEPITVFKFRTMFKDASSSPLVPQAQRDDPRVTWVGRFLRRSSLDELPQLFNVCRGDMSLVGPRPHAVAHNELYANLVEAYSARHRVKPGITGWAQVNGSRGETPNWQAMQKRVEYDLFYIRNWSFGFDLRILFRTIACVFGDPNAY